MRRSQRNRELEKYGAYRWNQEMVSGRTGWGVTAEEIRGEQGPSCVTLGGHIQEFGLDVKNFKKGVI